MENFKIDELFGASLSDLKKWVDTQIKKGNTHFDIEFKEYKYDNMCKYEEILLIGEKRNADKR